MFIYSFSDNRQTTENINLRQYTEEQSLISSFNIFLSRADEKLI